VGGAGPEELSDEEAGLASPPKAASAPAQEMRPSPADRPVPHPIITTAYERLRRRLPTSRRGRLIAGALILGLALIPSLALVILPVWLDLNEESLKGLGYAGIFLANLASTATVFLPVPGLTAAGQALIIWGGDTLNPVLAGLLGGLGMALGEVTAYAAGTVGGDMARGRHVGGPPWVRRVVEGTARAVGWLMARYGMLTLLILSAIPNPVFELAGLTAGAVRMPFGRFMAPVLVGKCIRGLALAFIGASGVKILGLG
jgi:membrane protein DedA with SNARE-associated domain